MINVITSFDGRSFPREEWASRILIWLHDRTPWDQYPVTASVLTELVGELLTLREERQPFKLVLDAALERGVADGKCDAAVLDLAQRLGFNRRIKAGAEVVVEVLVPGSSPTWRQTPIAGKVVAIRNRSHRQIVPDTGARFLIEMLSPDEEVVP